MTGMDDTANTAAPLLQPLGDPDAAVCTDGFCAVPSAPASTGADE